MLAAHVPAPVRPLLSFELGPRAVESIAARIVGWVECDVEVRERTRRALVETVGERWSWESVAESVIAAARGQLGALPEP